MSDDYTRTSATEWQWTRGNKHHNVRYFPKTGRLIWSGWVQTGDGPLFDEGFAQPVENFLQEGIDHIERVADRQPPPALLAELRATLSEPPRQSRNWLGWLFGD